MQAFGMVASLPDLLRGRVGERVTLVAAK